MNLESIFVILASFVAIMAAICTGIYFIVSRFTLIKEELAVLKTKMEIVISHLRRRGTSEGINKDFITMNSPINLTNKARDSFSYCADLRKDLIKFYQEEGNILSDNDLFIEIDVKFGERIMHDISKMFGVHYGACLVAAIEIAKEDSDENSKKSINS